MYLVGHVGNEEKIYRKRGKTTENFMWYESFCVEKKKNIINRNTNERYINKRNCISFVRFVTREEFGQCLLICLPEDLTLLVFVYLST